MNAIIHTQNWWQAIGIMAAAAVIKIIVAVRND
jgi:hypothetical protein